MGRRHEDADVLAEELLGRVLEQAFCGRVDDLDEAALVDRDQRVRSGFDNRAEQRFALCGRHPPHGVRRNVNRWVHQASR
jgi:hypothetical protein